MAQVSTPPDKMMHRLDLREGSSPPVRWWMVEREDSKMDRNWSTLDGLMCVLGEEFVMVASLCFDGKDLDERGVKHVLCFEG